MHKFIILIVIYLTTIGRSNCYSNTQYWRRDTFERVIISFEVHGDRTAFEKTRIIGKLAAQLCKELNFKNYIYMDFDYDDQSQPFRTPRVNSYISIDDGNRHSGFELMTIRRNLSQEDTLAFFKKIKKKYIHLRQQGNNFSIYNSLKLLEFAIMNRETIIKDEKIYWIDDFVFKGIFIDTLINTINSKELVKTFSHSIFLTEEDRFYGLGCYWLNNEYHIYFGRPDDASAEIYRVNDLFQIDRLSDRELMIFDTDTSFYYIRHEVPERENCVQRKIINSIEREFTHYLVINLWSDKVHILSNFYYSPFKQKSMLYLTLSNTLIDDFDELIERCK